VRIDAVQSAKSKIQSFHIFIMPGIQDKFTERQLFILIVLLSDRKYDGINYDYLTNIVLLNF
jgi:hypothetical protein